MTALVARTSRSDAKTMAGRQKLHSFKTSPRPRHGGKGKYMIEPRAVGPRRDHPGGEQAFDFRGEKQPIALPAPKSGAIPNRSRPRCSCRSLHIPQRDRKLSAESRPDPFIVVFPKMRNDLGVAVCDEAMAARCEFRTSLDVVEQLAVEDHENAAVFVCHRLLAIRQSDNAQTARGHGDAGSLEKPFLIRTAMHDRARHPLYDPGRCWSLPDQIDDPCNPAHDSAYHRRGGNRGKRGMTARASRRFATQKKHGKGRVGQVENEYVCTSVNVAPYVSVTFATP